MSREAANRFLPALAAAGAAALLALGGAWAQAPKPAADAGRTEWLYSVRFKQQGDRITVDGMNQDARTTLAVSDRIVACDDAPRTKVARLEDLFLCGVPSSFAHRFAVSRGGKETFAGLDLSARAAQELNAGATRSILGVVFVQWDDAVLVKQVSRTDTPLRVADIVVSCPAVTGIIESLELLGKCRTAAGTYELRVVRQGKEVPVVHAPRK